MSNAQNISFETLHSGQFTLATQLIILNYDLLYSPTNAAPQFIQKFAPYILK